MNALCVREKSSLLRGRAVTDRLLFVDISSGAFDAEALGLTFEHMQSSLHARFADGRWVTGLDATLWSWRAAGLGFRATPLTWRALRPLFEFGYRLFCRLRPHLAWVTSSRGWPPLCRSAVRGAGVKTRIRQAGHLKSRPRTLCVVMVPT